MPERRHRKRPSHKVETWELDLIRKVAGAFRTHEREELEGELARKLLDLKSRPLVDIRDWQAYLAKFLYNKSANWIRDARAREKRAESLPDGPDGPLVFSAEGPQDDFGIAFQDLYNVLDPELRRLWQVLIEENGNQVAAARRLGKHRNTIRHRIEKLKRILAMHGF